MARQISYVPRPDRVTATGVIAPYPVRQYDPVNLARKTIWPFVQGVRSVGPVYSAKSEPSPEAIVNAATAVARQQVSGLGQPTPPRTPIEAQIQQCAEMIKRGRPFLVKSAGRLVKVQPDVRKAFWHRRSAFATGTTWDIVAGRRDVMRAGPYPSTLPEFK